MNKKLLFFLISILSIYSLSLYAQNNCLEFDGSDDYVDCGFDVSLDITDNTVSIEAWLFPTDFKDAHWKNTIVANDYWDINNSAGYVFRYGGPNGDLDFTFSNIGGNWVSVTANSVLLLNTWQHVAVIYNGTTAKLYVDGEEKASSNLSNNILSSTQPLNIGRSTGDPSGRMLVAKLDELRIWGDARTQTEIVDNMNREITGTEQDLVAYYRFNEGSGQVVNDATGTNDGILGSGTLSDSADPTWVLSDMPLPVTLSNFTAAYIQDSEMVSISWITQSEINSIGWNIYRSTENEDFLKLNGDIIIGAGTSSEPTHYSFSDDWVLTENTTYEYWLENLDISNINVMYGPISVKIHMDEDEEDGEVPDLIDNFGLFQNYPNPFNPNTTISFCMQEDTTVELIIFDIKGKIVRTLVKNQIISKGKVCNYTWNGLNDNGEVVGSGIYFYKLKADSYETTKKMILMK